MSELNKASIVIPIYNAEKHITECLTSIINQTYYNIEIICVDDCSQDSSLKIIKEFSKKDDRVKIVQHKKNKGQGGARNTGLDSCEGEYLLFIDSDDYITKDCVETVIEKMNSTLLNTIIFKADMYWQYTNEKRAFWHEKYRNFPEGFFSFNDDLLASMPMYCWNKCYKKSFLKENNIRWPENTLFEDVEFFLKIFTISPVTYMIDKVLYTYRIHGDSIMGNCFANRKNSDDLYTKTLPSIYKYFVENDLLNKYPKSFLQLINTNLNNFRMNNGVMKKNAKIMLDFLNSIGFPDNYKKYQEL